MYPFERLMKGCKGLVRYINGCIARGYVLQEASLYSMEDISNDGGGTHKHTRHAFLDDDDEFADEMSLSIAKPITLTQAQFQQSCRWLLSKYVGINEWQRKYDLYVNNDNFNSQENLSSKNGPKSFLLWLRDEMIEAKETKSILWRLVKGPLFKAQSYNKYQSNGFDFSSHDYEEGFVTQNSGVSMKAITRHRAKSTDRSLVEAKITYYGVIKQIIKLDYMELRKLFVTVIGSELKIRVMDANLIQSQAQ